MGWRVRVKLCLLFGHFVVSGLLGVPASTICHQVQIEKAEDDALYNPFGFAASVSAKPEEAINDLSNSVTRVHDSALMIDISSTLDRAKNSTDTKAFLDSLSRTFQRRGGRQAVMEQAKEIEGLSSSLRGLRVLLIKKSRESAAGQEHFRAQADKVQALYAKNQKQLGLLRLALSYENWNRASQKELDLVDLQLMPGKSVDEGIKTYLNADRDPHTVEDAPSLMIRIKYSHGELMRLLREGKIDEQLYFALTFSRRTNTEVGTTAYGTSWYSADGGYGRTSVVAESGNAPVRLQQDEGRIESGGGWVRAVPPKGSFMVLRLEAPKNVHNFTRPEREALAAQDGRATQGTSTRPEYHWIAQDGHQGAGKGEAWVRSVFGELPGESATPFASYDKQGVTVLFGGENGVPAQQWDGGSTLSNPVGKFITESFSHLREARLHFEKELLVAPGERGTIIPSPGKKPRYKPEVPSSPNIHLIGAETYKRNLDKADELIAAMDARMHEYIGHLNHYDKTGQGQLEGQTYLDFIRFMTELKQLKEARASAHHALSSFNGKEYIAPEAAQKTGKASDALNEEDMETLKAHRKKFPGSFLTFDSKILDVMRDLEQRRQDVVKASKQTTQELSKSTNNKFDFVIFDGLVGGYLAQKLIERGVPPDRILFVGTTDSPFLKFAGISSFETANETLKAMGVDLEKHKINLRPEGTLVPSTTAPAEANLNSLQKLGVRHAFGKLTVEAGPDGTSRYVLVDAESGTRAEIQVEQKLIYSPGLAYPESIGDPNVLNDKEFYRMAKQQTLQDMPIIPAGKSVMIIGSGGASASVEKLVVGTAVRHLEAGKTPGEIIVVGNQDAFNNGPRFGLDVPRNVLKRAGFFEFIPGRIDAPRKTNGEIVWHSVQKITEGPDKGRYRVTPYEKGATGNVPLPSRVVDYVIDTTASVAGQKIIESEAAAFAPNGYVLQTANDNAFLGLNAKGENPVTVVGPPAAILGAKLPRVSKAAPILLAQARLAQGNGDINGQPTSPFPIVGKDGKLVFDIGPFSAQSLAAAGIAEAEAKLWHERNPNPKP